MAKTPEGDVAIKSPDINLTDKIRTVDSMPKATRLPGNRSKNVRILVDLISDGEKHLIEGVTEETRDIIRRKLVYAARLAHKKVKTVFLREDSADGDPAGLYFRGVDKESDEGVRQAS